MTVYSLLFLTYFIWKSVPCRVSYFVWKSVPCRVSCLLDGEIHVFHAAHYVDQCTPSLTADMSSCTAHTHNLHNIIRTFSLIKINERSDFRPPESNVRLYNTLRIHVIRCCRRCNNLKRKKVDLVRPFEK